MLKEECQKELQLFKETEGQFQDYKEFITIYLTKFGGDNFPYGFLVFEVPKLFEELFQPYFLDKESCTVRP